MSTFLFLDVSITIILLAAPKTVVPPANVVVNAVAIQKRVVLSLVPGNNCDTMIATGTFEKNWLNMNSIILKATNVPKLGVALLSGVLINS